MEPPSAVAQRRPRKRKISVDIDAELLERVDRAAQAMGISRNAVLALGASRFVGEAMRD
ncbi:ribbon-helix-helix protein, CopG family [Burkholderia pseudomallei]|nr:ribbon-helix-helix protein, CopG family [Burkholderia pseudomallei]